MELKDLLKRLAELEDADALIEAVNGLSAQIKDLETQLRKANSTVEGYKGRVQQLDGEREELQQTVDAMRGEMEEVQTKLDTIPGLETKAALAARYETLAAKPSVFTNKALLKLVTSSNLSDNDLLELVDEMETAFAQKPAEQELKPEPPKEETILEQIVGGKVQVPSGQQADAGFASARTPEVVMSDIMAAIADGNQAKLQELMVERDNITQAQPGSTRL